MNNTEQISFTEAEKNIVEFFDKQRTEGFLRLYFTNYLFEIVMQFLRSGEEEKDFDSAYAYHFVEGKLVSPEDEKKFKVELRRECRHKAGLIVSRIQERELIEKFGLDLDSITKQMTETVNEALKAILEEVFATHWGEK